MSYLVATSAHADQIVSGPLPSGNTIWNITPEPYVIDTSINGPIDVPVGSTLTITTGVTVKNRNTNKSAITISGGTLNATGATFQFETSASTAGGKQPIIVSGAGSATFTLCAFTVSDGATSTNMESKVLTATNSAVLNISGSTFTTGTGQGQPTWYAVWTGNSAVLNITASDATPTSFSGFPISVFSSSSAGVAIANAAIAVKDIGVQLINAGVGVIADSSFTAGSDAVKLYGIENSGTATLTVNTSGFTGLAQGVRVVQAGTVSLTSLTATSNTTGVLITQATGVTIAGGTYSSNGTAVQIDANAASTINNNATNNATFSGNTYGIVMNSPANLTVTDAAFTNNGQGIRALRVGTLSLTGVTVDNTTVSPTSIGIYTDVMTALLAASTTIQKQGIGLRLHHNRNDAVTTGITFSQNNRNVLFDGEYTLEDTNQTLPVGRYILNNDSGPISINDGSTLTLLAGTEILNKNQNQNLFQISGVLNATGVAFILKTASHANGGAGTAVFDFAGGDGTFTHCTFRSSDTVSEVNSRVINLRDNSNVSVVGCDLASTPESGLFKTAKGIVVSETAILNLNSSSGARTTVSGFIHGVYSTSLMDLTVRDTDFMLNDTGLYYSSDFDLRLINSTFTFNNWGIALPNVGFLLTQNSSASDNTYALSLTWLTVHRDFSGLTFARNTFDSFLAGTITLAGNVTLQAMHYRVDLSTGPIVIPAGAQLTIFPGTAFTNNVATSSSQRNDLFDVRGTLNATGATFTINTRRDASSGSSSRGTYGFSFAGSGIGTFTDCVFSASDNLNSGTANSRIMNLADSAAVTVAGSNFSSTVANGFKTQFGIVINNSAALTVAGTATHSQSAFSGFPIAIQTSTLANFSNTAFTDCEHGILYLGTNTLTANYTLPQTVVSFENPLIVPAGITLTIPSGTALRNYNDRTALDVAGIVNASGAAFEFVTHYNPGTQAIILRGAATGTFTNCTFTASDRGGNANSRIFQLLNTASVSLSGCALTSTTARGNKTYYGVVVNDNASLALTAAGATRSSFTGFPHAIQTANLNVSVAGTDFTANDRGLIFPSAITLSADWTLPAADIAFNQTVIIPAGITLTIPAGTVIRNPGEAQVFLVRGHLQATAGASFIVANSGGITALQFEGTGTGSFANCTFTAYNTWPYQTNNRVMYIRESAAVTIRDCIFQGRTDSQTAANTPYGISVVDQGVLRFETGSGSPSGSSFDGFSSYGISYSSNQPLTPIADLDFTNCNIGLTIANQSGKTVTIRDSSFSGCGTGVQADTIGTLTLQNLAIDHCGTGILTSSIGTLILQNVAVNQCATGISASSIGTLTQQDVAIDRCTTTGLNLSSVTTLAVTNVSVANSATAMTLVNVSSFDPSGFALTNNTVDWSIQGGVTLTTNASLPVYTTFNGPMVIPAGVTLTIPAGRVIRNSSYTQTFLVRGSLQATAGASFEISDGGGAIKALQFEGTGTGAFTNCTFTTTNFYSNSTGSMSIYIGESAAVTIRDCAFQGRKSNPGHPYPTYGIYVDGQGILRFETGQGSPSGTTFDGFYAYGVSYGSNQPLSALADLHFTNCGGGLYITNQSGKAVAIRDSSFSGCGTGVAAGSMDTLMMQDLAVNQCGTGIQASTVGTLTLQNVAIDRCTTAGLSLSSVTGLAATDVSIANCAAAMQLFNSAFNPSGIALANNTVDWSIEGTAQWRSQGGVTLTGNAILPANTVFNSYMIVAEGVTLTIPAGRVIRNSTTIQNQIFLVRGHLDATAGAAFVAIVTAYYGPMSALEFEGTGTGSFANCTFTAADNWAEPYPSYDRIIRIRNSAAVTLRDCAFEARGSNPNYVKTSYGIVVADNGALNIDEGQEACTFTGFHVAAILFESGTFRPGPLHFSENTADIRLNGVISMIGDADMPEQLVFGSSSAKITVPDGSTLTIPPGFVFTSLPGQNPFAIQGHLLASDATFNVKPGGYAFDFRGHGVGTFSHCRFNSTSGSPSQWIMNVADNADLSMTDCSVVTSNSSLDFKGNSRGTLANCSFGASDSSSSSTQRVVNLADNAEVIVDQCKIGNVNENGFKIGYAFAAANSSKLSVTNSIISGFLWGVHYNGGTPFVLTDSVLAQCGTGLQIAKVPANYTIRNNDFFTSADYAVFNNSTTVVDCRENYWGHSTGPRYPTSPGGLGDRISDYILFEPFHTDTDGLTQIEVGNHSVGQTGNAFGTPGNHANALLARFSLALDGEPVRRVRLGFEPSAALITLKLINARLVRDVNGNGVYDPATDGAPVAGAIDFTAKSITFATTITADGGFLVLADAVALDSQDAAALTLTAAGVTADPGIIVVGGMTSALHYVDRLYLGESRGVPESDNLGTAADQDNVELLSFFLTPGYAINSLTFRLTDLSGIDRTNFLSTELAIDADADGAVDIDETVIGGGQVTTSGSTGTIRFTFTSPAATGNSYILHANLAGLVKDDRLTVGLPAADVGASTGVAIAGAVAAVTHRVEIPLLILDTAFMRRNQFVQAARLEDVVLLAFTFIPSGRRIDGLTFRLTEVHGLRAADVTRVRLIWDLNRNGVDDDGEIETGGPGAVSIDMEAGTGSITFSLPFMIQGEYLMLAEVARLEDDDTLTIGITGDDVRVGPRDVVEGGVSPVTHDVVRPERQQSSLNQNWTLNYRSPGGISAYGAYSHAGDRVIIGYSSGTAYIYDAASNTPQVMLHKHYDRIQYVGFSADDAKVITVTRDGAIYIWNVATQELEKNLFSDILVRYAVPAPDMSKLFIVTEGRGLLLDLNTGQRLWELVIGTQLNSADYSTDGSSIVVGANDKRTYLVNAATGVIIRSFQGHSQLVTGATFAANGTRMLSNSPDATATLWKVTDNVTPLATVTLAGQSGVSATVNSQGTRIAMLTSSGAYYLRLFDENALEIWARQLSATEFTGSLGTFEFDDAGERILLTSHGGFARTAHFRVTDGAFLGSWGPRAPLSGSYNHRVRIANDGDQIFYMNGSGLDLIHRHTGKTISTLLGGDQSYDITPDGKKVLVRNGSNIELYSLEDGRFTLVTSNSIGADDVITLSESGGLVITGDRIYRTRTGELYVNTPNLDAGYPSAFSPNESLWGIAFSGDQSIKTQRTSDNTGKLEYPVTLTAPYRPFKIFYHPDGIRVGCVDSSAGVQMYRLDNNDPVGLYDYRTSGPGIRDAELSKDGTMLLIARGNNVKLFDMTTGQVLRYFYPQHSDQGSDNVQAIGFGRDDRTIMIAWTHNYVELYDRAKLTRLEISPTARTLDVGESQRFVVRAVYDDGSQINVSPRYKRRNNANADFNPGENAIEFAPGAVLLADPPDGVTIDEDVVTVNAGASDEILLTAVYTEAGLTRSAAAEITVGQAQLTALDATPEQVTLSKGVVIPISYIAIFSDGYSEDVSDRVAMTADRPDRVRIVPPNVSINLTALPGDIQVTGQFTFRSTTRSATTTIANHGARSEWERTVVTPGGDGLGLEFSPNGTRMATGSGSGAITIYRVGVTPTQYEIDQTFIAHERPVRFLTYLSNTELLTVGEDGAIRKWNLADTSAPVQEYLHDAVITGVAYNGGTVAFGDNTGRVMLLNLATNSLRWIRRIHDKGVTTVALDANSILSGGQDEVVILSQRADGAKIFKYTGFSEPLVNVGYMGSMTYAAAGDNRMQIWNKGTEDENLREYYYPATPTNVNYLNVGNAYYLYVSTVFLTNATWVYNQDGLLLRWYEHPPAEGNIRSLRVTPNGEHLVTGRSTGTVIREKLIDGKKVLVPEISAFHSYQFWNVSRGNFNGELNHSFSLTDAKVNEAGTRLYTQCSKRTLAWDLSDSFIIGADNLLETGYFVPFSFSGIQLTDDDPGHLATRVGDSIFILDANQRLLEKTVNTTTSNFAISPNGTRLMTNGNCSGSNCVRFWDISLIFPTVIHENERLSATTAMAFIDNDDSVGTIPGDGFIARYNSQGQQFSGINFEQLSDQELAGARPEEIVVNGNHMGVVAVETLGSDPPTYLFWVQVYDIHDRLEATLVRSDFLGEFVGFKPKASVALSNDGNLLFWGFERPPTNSSLQVLSEIETPLGEDAAAGHVVDISTGQLLNIFLPPSMGTIYNQGVAAAQFTRNDGALMIAWKEGYAAIYERQGLSSIQVSPVARTLPPTSSVTIATRAIFADGSILDVTAAATLSTATPNLVTINGNTVTVNPEVAQGTQIIVTATYRELGVTRTANVTLTVGQPTFLNMTVDPARLSVNAGTVIQYHFIGEFQGTGVQDITGFTTVTAVPADRVTITGNTVQVKANAQFGELLITGISVRNGEERSATAVLQIRNPFDISDRGDFDGDRDVDFNDLVYFVGQYGETSASISWDSRTDLDADHDVDFNDLTAFVGLYGTHYTARSASAAREDTPQHSGAATQFASDSTLSGVATALCCCDDGLAAREAGPLVRVTLEGPPAPVRIGEVFELRIKVQEFSAQASGFRGGPLDIQFDLNTVDYAGVFDSHEIIQPPFNTIVTNGHLRSRLIDELGGVTVADGQGESEPVLYAILKFTAKRAGVAEFTVAAGETGLALAPPVGQVSIGDISYGPSVMINIREESSSPADNGVTYPLVVDWNLIGVPFVPSEASQDEFLSQEHLLAIWGWLPETGYFTPEALEAKFGYWVRFGADRVVTLAGAPVSDTGVVLRQGWNLVSPVADTGSPEPIKGVTACWGWTPEGGYFRVGASGVCQRGQGYWMYATEDGVVIWE